MQKITRPCGGFSDNFIISAILSLVIVIIGGNLAVSLFGFLNIQEKLTVWLGSDNMGAFLSDYLLTIGLWIAGLLFMAMHMANPGFTVVAGSQIFLAGLIWALIVYYYDSVWVAFWFHAAWNYTQNIIFGLPNSGVVSEYSIFRLEAASARNGLFYNVNFGVEGSIGSSLILLVILIALIVINRGKPEKRDYWADLEDQAAKKRGMMASAQ